MLRPAARPQDEVLASELERSGSENKPLHLLRAPQKTVIVAQDGAEGVNSHTSEPLAAGGDN